MTGDKATRYLILLAALALAAYGQHIIDSREAFGSGWLAIDWLHDELTRIYGRPQSVALALPLLGFGAWFFVESINPLLPNRPSVPPQPPPRQLPRLDRSPESIATIVFGVAAIGAWVLLLVRLYGKTSEDNSVIDWWIFWSALVASALALGIWRRLSVRDVGATVRWHPLEYAFAAALAGFFIGLMSYDLDAWQYARIGDEGVFWDIATSIADGTNERNFFTYQGANGYHPMFSSIYQGWVMKAAGADMFGWKLSNTLAIAAALPVFYWLVRTMFNVRTALFASAIVGCNQVMFAYAHTGYDNTLAILPAVTALGLFVAGWRTRDPLLFLLAGMAAGLCFYTFYTARITVIVIAIFLASEYVAHWWRTRSFSWILEPLPLAAGFVLASAPLFALDGWGVISETNERSLFSDAGWSAGLGTMIDNIPRAFLAFSFWPADHHYVSGSFLDEISAVLAVMGLGFTLSNFKKPMYRLLLIWFVVAVFIGGVLHEHAHTEMPSRLNFAVPPAAALAAIAIDKLVLAFAPLYRTRWALPAMTAVTFAVLVPSVFGLNAYRFYDFTPSIHVLTNTAVVYKEATSDACDLEGYVNIVVARSSEQGGVEDVFRWYDRSDRAPVFIAFEDPDNDRKRQEIFDGTFAAGTPISCIMFTVPEDEAGFALIDSYTAELERYGGNWITSTDKAGASQVVVLDWLSRASRPVSGS